MSVKSLKAEEKALFLETGNMLQVDDPRLKEGFRERVKAFLNKLKEACVKIEYVEDYTWISEGATRWKAYLRSEYGELDSTEIMPPERALKTHLTVLEHPFEVYLNDSPSSGSVMREFTIRVLRIIGGADTLESVKKDEILKLIELVEKHRPLPSYKLTRLIFQNLDDVEKLKVVLHDNMKTSELIPNVIGDMFKHDMERCYIPSNHNMFLYGYSELLPLILTVMTEEMKKQTTLYVAECRYRFMRHDGVRTIEEVTKIGFRPKPVLDMEYYDIFRNGEVKTLIMGCKAIGINNTGLEVLNTVGSGMLARCAKEFKIKVCILAGKNKVFNENLFHEAIEKYSMLELVRERKGMPISGSIYDYWGGVPGIRMQQSDVITEDCIDFFITELGVQSPKEFQNNYEKELSSAEF